MGEKRRYTNKDPAKDVNKIILSIDINKIYIFFWFVITKMSLKAVHWRSTQFCKKKSN